MAQRFSDRWNGELIYAPLTSWTRYGDWYCFEVNPSPAFAFYEQRTGQPISAALVEMLRNEQPIHKGGAENIRH